MLNPMMSRDRSRWNIFAISLTVLFALISASPQSSGRRSGGNNPGISITIDGRPELRLPCAELYSRVPGVMFFPIIYPTNVETVQVLSGPPDVGLLFVNTRDEGRDFVSQVIYSPENKGRYPSGTSAMRGPFANPNYIVLFILPSGLDPSRLIGALTHSQDEAEPDRPDAGFHLYLLAFAGSGVTGLYAAEQFDEAITVQKAAIVHASNPNSRVGLVNEQKNIVTEITLRDQMVEPFRRAKFIVGGESPPPGPLLGRENLNDL